MPVPYRAQNAGRQARGHQKNDACGNIPPNMLSTSQQYPQVGSRWQDRDRRAKRTVQVIRIDESNRRVRIHCIETDVLSWAKPERFNGKSGGYQPLTGAKRG